MERSIQELLSILVEALGRDADEYHLMQFCARWQQMDEEQPKSHFGIAFEHLRFRFPAYPTLSKHAHHAFESAMKEEFARLDPFIQNSFNFRSPNGKIVDRKKSPIAFVNHCVGYYIPIRVYYYVFGYYTADLFKDIKPENFLGQPVIGGLHLAFREKLKQVNLSAAVKRAIRSYVKKVEGFVPRMQDNSRVASNHSAGLAIDINSTFNPDVGGKGREFKRTEEIFALKQITGYDFGKPPPANLSIEQLYEEQKEASDKLQAWLRSHLYENGKPEQTSYHNPEQPSYHLLGGGQSITPYHLIQLEHNEFRVTDQSLLNTLRQSRTEHELLNWMEVGILSLPLTLIKAMIDAGFTWGGRFGRHKDFMHFQLELSELESSLGKPEPHPLKELDFFRSAVALQKVPLVKPPQNKLHL
jgi:hypothetical protein